MNREDFPELKSPSVDGHCGALTADIFSRENIAKWVEQERLARKRRETEALAIRKNVWKKCLAFHSGDREKAEEMYFNIELKAAQKYIESGLAPLEYYI